MQFWILLILISQNLLRPRKYRYLEFTKSIKRFALPSYYIMLFYFYMEILKQNMHPAVFCLLTCDKYNSCCQEIGSVKHEFGRSAHHFLCGGKRRCTQNVWQNTTVSLPTKNCFMYLHKVVYIFILPWYYYST